MESKQLGVMAGLAAFCLWGVFPVYFKLIDEVPSSEVLAHRIVWSFVFLFIYLLASKRSLFRAVFQIPWRGYALLFLSAILISLNWLVFIYAIVSEKTLDASLGYFINPIFSIALGVLFLGERLNRWQLVSLMLAAVAVVYQLIDLGTLPWISLTLAASFGLYGMIRKHVKVDSIQGLFVETIILTPFAFGFLLWLHWGGELLFLQSSRRLDIYLVFAGFVTAVPLILFAVGVRRIPLSQMGFFQYLAPSLQFLIAVLVFAEPLAPAKLVSFILVWCSLAILLLAKPIERSFHHLKTLLRSRLV